MIKKTLLRSIVFSLLFLIILVFIPIYPSAKYKTTPNNPAQELELVKEFRASLFLNMYYGFEHTIPSSPQYIYKRSKNFLFVYAGIAIIGIGAIFALSLKMGKNEDKN